MGNQMPRTQASLPLSAGSACGLVSPTLAAARSLRTHACSHISGRAAVCALSLSEALFSQDTRTVSQDKAVNHCSPTLPCWVHGGKGSCSHWQWLPEGDSSPVTKPLCWKLLPEEAAGRIEHPLAQRKGQEAAQEWQERHGSKAPGSWSCLQTVCSGGPASALRGSGAVSHLGRELEMRERQSHGE